jgi:hypothetical protein
MTPIESILLEALKWYQEQMQALGRRKQGRKGNEPINSITDIIVTLFKHHKTYSYETLSRS